MLGGWAFERFGPRLVLIMAFLTGLSLLLASQVHVVWQLFVSYSLLLALGTGALYVAIMPLIFRWFEQKGVWHPGLLWREALSARLSWHHWQLSLS